MTEQRKLGKMRRGFFSGVALGCFLLFIPPAHARTFTAKDGRTLEAKVQKVTAESAILMRSDGRSVTVPLNLLIDADRKFLAEWAAEEARNRVPRVEVGVDSNKRDTNVAAGYEDRRGSFQFEISIDNEERDFRIEKATATLIVLGDYLYTPGEGVVMQRKEFKDISMDFGKTYVLKAPEVRYEYDKSGYTHGQKYTGYVFILRTAGGKIIDIAGSTTRLENLADIILKLKQGDHFNKRYQKIRTDESGTSTTLR